MRSIRRAWIHILSAVVVLSASATTAQAQLTHVTTVEGISEYRLDNGLRVLFFPDESAPTVTVNITYLVGSRHEAYGETGMAHLLEHLVFKGTPRYPNIPQELTARGASPNGTTWFDRTNYFETLTATEDNLAWALDLEADRMVNSFISGDDLASEMTVVRNEFEAGENSPFRVLMERVLSTMYLWHNYGNSTIGARADLENVPIERLQAFYRRSTTSRTTRCWWWRAASTRRAPVSWSSRSSAQSPVRTARRHADLAHLHAGPGAGRRAQRHAAARR
jgi:zinc protease